MENIAFKRNSIIYNTCAAKILDMKPIFCSINHASKTIDIPLYFLIILEVGPCADFNPSSDLKFIHIRKVTPSQCFYNNQNF